MLRAATMTNELLIKLLNAEGIETRSNQRQTPMPSSDSIFSPISLMLRAISAVPT
jgi:hypothetical protein